MPRIGTGTPGFNWYTIEKVIRARLAAKSIPIYIYYFKRGSVPQVTSSASSDLLVSAPNKFNDESPLMEKAKSYILDDDVGDIVIPKIQEKLPDVFVGVNALIHSSVNDNYKFLKRYIIAYGGIVTNKPDKNTTHIIVNLSKPDNVIEKARKLYPQITIVTMSWAQECIKTKKLVPLAPNYLL